jgi:hypothetical protein
LRFLLNLLILLTQSARDHGCDRLLLELIEFLIGLVHQFHKAGREGRKVSFQDGNLSSGKHSPEVESHQGNSEHDSRCRRSGEPELGHQNYCRVEQESKYRGDDQRDEEIPAVVEQRNCGSHCDY